LKHSTIQIQTSPKPFVKWAGGKRQLLSIISQHIPSTLNSYFEPFLGGGAVFFYLRGKNPNLCCQVSDLNSDLILSYQIIRDNVFDLIESLENHSKNYFQNSYSYYYTVRDENPIDPIEKVARFIFLNRTCFNGLFRVNKKGKFNVPLGKYSNPNIVNKENLLNVNHFLQTQNVSIKCCDFEISLEDVREGDFVYLDPPYQPISITSSFTSYTSAKFAFGQQKRLYEVVRKLDKHGCKVLISNSNTNEIIDLFSKVCPNVIEVECSRYINSNPANRTGHSELLFKNY